MPTDLLSIARDVAVKAGSLAKHRRAEGVEVAASKSSPLDIVTEADRETEVLIRSLLADARPDDGFFGLERVGRESDELHRQFLVDDSAPVPRLGLGVPAELASPVIKGSDRGNFIVLLHG